MTPSPPEKSMIESSSSDSMPASRRTLATSSGPHGSRTEQEQQPGTDTVEERRRSCSLVLAPMLSRLGRNRTSKNSKSNLSCIIDAIDCALEVVGSDAEQ